MKPANEQIKNGNLLKFFRDYWFIVTVIVGLAFTITNYARDVIENTQVNASQDELILQNTASIGALEKKYIEDVSIIKTQLQAINEKLK